MYRIVCLGEILLPMQDHASRNAGDVASELTENEAVGNEIVIQADLRRMIPVELIPQEFGQLSTEKTVGNDLLQVFPALKYDLRRISFGQRQKTLSMQSKRQ